MFGLKSSSSSSPSLPDYHFTPAQLRYLEILQSAEHDWSITRLCAEAGIHRASYYRWQREPGFAYQLAKMAIRHISVSAPVFFARVMNSALNGGPPLIWNAAFRFLTTPKAMDALQANLAALAQLATAEGASNTKKWDANQDLGPHHLADAREKLQCVGRSSIPPELENFYDPAARASRQKAAPESPKPVQSVKPPSSNPAANPAAGIPAQGSTSEAMRPPLPPAPEAPRPAEPYVSTQPIFHPLKRFYRNLLSRSARRHVRLILAGAHLQPAQQLVLAS